MGHSFDAWPNKSSRTMTTVTPAQPTFFWAPAKISPNYKMQEDTFKSATMSWTCGANTKIWLKGMTRISIIFMLKIADVINMKIWGGKKSWIFYSVSFSSSPLTHPQAGTGSWRTCHWRGPPRLFQVWSCIPHRGLSRCNSSTRRRLRGSGSSCWSRGFLEGATTKHI